MKILLALLDYLQQSNLWINMHFLSTITFILLFFFFFFFFFFFLIVRHQKPTQKSPPSPPRLPIIGNLHQLGSLPHRSLQALSNKYGSIMLLRIGCVPTIIVSSEEMAREVMKKNDLRVASRPKSSMAKMLMYDCDLAFAPYGEYWRQVRKISVTHLLSIKMVQSFCSIREEEVSTMIDKICASQRGLVDLSELFVSLTSDIICRVALGRKYCEGVGAKKVRDMLGEFGNLLGSFPIGDFIPWLGWMDHLRGLNSRARKNSKELDSFLEEVLEEHLRAKRDANGKCKEGGDFVDILLSLDERDERFVASLEKDEKVGVSLSLGRDSIKAIILDMFAAGTDTTYTTLLWTMAELMRNPKVMKKAQVEVRSVIGHNQKHISDKEIDRMPYLKAIIKESLRLNTPVPLLVPRETTQDIELLSFHIPKGTRVIVNAWAIARDPRSWENPADFMPERFLDSDVDFRGPDFRFIPFGAGRRSCPGAGFAIPTVELALASLLRHFDWEMPEGMEAEVLDMTESPGMTLHKKTGLVLVAKPCIV